MSNSLQASFKALNLESDDESDIEIDNTKELQIEEALKLYQSALKFHSDGPSGYDEAAKAYKALFESEIFKYPESQSELQRIDLLGDQDVWADDQHDTIVEPLLAADNTPSTLPQILHLAHKNYGDFILANLATKGKSGASDSPDLGWMEIHDASLSALDHFVEALDKDETDVDAWEQTATVGRILDSPRIVRYCLESILDDEENSIEDIMLFSGFSEGAAGQKLYQSVLKLGDTLSLLQGPLNKIKRRRLKNLLYLKVDSIDQGFNAQRLQLEAHAARLRKQASSSYHIPLPSPASWPELVRALAGLCSGEAITDNPGTIGGIVKFTGSAALPDTVMCGEDNLNFSTQIVTLPDVSDIDSIYPGLDRGRPTAPVPVFGDIAYLQHGWKREERHASLATRKRSSDAAALEAQDGGRVKSKRLRARESLIDLPPALEQSMTGSKKIKKDPYEETEATDAWCFKSIDDVLEKLRAETFGDLATRRPRRKHTLEDENSADSPADIEGPVIYSNLYRLLTEHPQNLPKLSPIKANESETDSDSPHKNLLAALESDTTAQTRATTKPPIHRDHGLRNMLDHINKTSLSINEVSFIVLQLLLYPGLQRLRPRLTASESSYLGHTWSESLKGSVIRILLTCDDYLFRTCASLLDNVTETSHQKSDGSASPKTLETVLNLVHMIQSMWELHLDVLSQAKYSGSNDLEFSVAEQRARVERWADHARDAIELRRLYLGDVENGVDELGLRYVWAMVAQIKLTDRASQSSVLSHLNELRDIFIGLDGPVVHLPNNSLMPVLSLDAIDREIAKLTTSDFFHKVFDSTQGDPVAIIEGLEPLMEHIHDKRAHLSDNKAYGDEQPDALPASAELIEFLCNCSNTVILALWKKLLVAYQIIEYTPMVTYCHFRMIEAYLEDFVSETQTNSLDVEKPGDFLRSVQHIHDALMRVIEISKVSLTVLECMDESRLQSLATALVRLLKILQWANFAEDEIRVGERIHPLEKDVTRLKIYRNTIKLLTDCQLSCWIVLYMVFQDPEVRGKYVAQDDFDLQRMEVLRSMHTATGLRGFCGGANRILLNLLKKELPALQDVPGYDLEFSQVLADLYGLNCFVNASWEQLPHDCAGDVSLDRAAAVQAVNLLLLQASKIKVTELYKHPLKEAFERVHVVVARKKPSDAILRNRQIIAQFLRAPINPLDLYRCLNGEGEINLVPLPPSAAQLAEKGWFFQMGFLGLTKFRSQKRVAAGPTDELDGAISFFSQDLEYGAEKWETWFRLAQAFDSKLEDQVTWNADKLNKSMEEISQLQRSAIHCYRMATALATRITDPEFESSANVAELYADFATRIYASSRPPFSMKAFSLLDATRFLSTHTLVKVPPFRPLSEVTAWKFAKVLYQRAIAGNQGRWILHYMLGKCLWKLFKATMAMGRVYCDPLLIVTAFQKAIELLPREKKDKKEPILEPHYRIVSTVHKLMTQIPTIASSEWEPPSIDEACDMISLTPYAKKVNRCEDMDEWDSYILNVLKQLRNADKANWHHRMIVRSARIVYGDDPSDGLRDYAATIGARHELTQQLFTKTMALQVWKPEFERAGRHFVYTRQYTMLFLDILKRLGDRPALEQLLRRVRKRTGDYFGFESLWMSIHDVYLSMVRKQSKIPPGHEAAIFSAMSYGEFFKKRDLLEKFCKDPETDEPMVEVLREAIEFKKVNQGLEKPTVVDELIGDVYALLFDTIGKRLWQEYQSSNTAPSGSQSAVDLAIDIGRPQPKAIDNLALPDAIDKTETSTPGDLTPVKRKIGIGRREIRNSAEACVTKASAPGPEMPTREVQIIINRRRPSLTSSRRDSADDESELSDVDEELVNDGGSPSARGSRFPGLAEQSGAEDEEEDAGEDDGMDGTAGDEGDDEGEGEDEGEEGDEDQDMEMQDTGEGDDLEGEGSATEVYATPIGGAGDDEGSPKE